MNNEMKRLGQYEVVKKLSVGGQGEVYLAKIEKPEFRFSKFVAIKVLNRHSGLSFENEIKVLTSIQHPNLCSILDVGSEDDRYYIVFEYIEGLDLKKFSLKLKEKNLSLNPDAILEIGEQAYSAIKYLHTSQTYSILHKDISPQNIMVSNDGTVKIIDFGISIFKGEDFAQSKELAGKPRYLPIEIVKGDEEYSEKTDMYSLGVVLYEILTGHAIFPGEPIPLKNVEDPRLRTLIQKLTNKSEELSKKDFEFQNSNLQSVASKAFDEKIISDYTITSDNQHRSSSADARMPGLKSKILIFLLIISITVVSVFAYNRNAILFPLQGEYVMIRPPKDSSATRFNENISTSLLILNNEIIKTETDLYGCRIVQRWRVSEYKSQIAVIKESRFELYEEYSKEKDSCLDNEKYKAMFSSGSDLAIRVELKLIDKTLHYRVLGMEGPFDEQYSKMSCRLFEPTCWKKL